MSWLNRGTHTQRTLTLGGYAGSGKSTVVSVVAHELLKLGPIAFCAFTGKASSVLSRKLAASGIQTVSRVVQKSLLGGVKPFEPRPYCGTIHGLVYRPCDVCMVEETHEHTYGSQCQEKGVPQDEHVVDDEDGIGYAVGDDKPCLACNPPPPKKTGENCHRCGNARYLRRDQLDRGYRLIVVDEASMVSDDILEALLSYRVPILAVGDHGQLPPVKGQGSLMKAPQLRLERIHRQAAGNPIIALSAYIRQHGDIDESLEDGEHFSILRRRDLDKWITSRFPAARRHAADADIMNTVVVSWTNKLRVALNEQVRASLDLNDVPPSKGEALICLKNAAPIYNGMRGVLMGDAERAGSEKAPKWKASVDFVEDKQVAKDILLSEYQFFQEKTIDYDQARELGVSLAMLGQLYDFGYAMTCHKMQGSQAQEVGVVIEPGMMRISREDRTRWIYTAVTRAAERLVVIR